MPPSPHSLLDDDRLFPPDPTTRALARELYAHVRDLPILSPHGHTQAAWFAHNQPFPNPTALLLQPDHYIFRMLYSQGITLESLGIGFKGTGNSENPDPRAAWRLFAANYFLFRGTPTRLWLDDIFGSLFGLTVTLSATTADLYFDTIAEHLATPAFRPRALFDRFRIDLLATTDSPVSTLANTDTLADHAALRASTWPNRIIPTFRPDNVVDPDHPHFLNNLKKLAEQTNQDTATWQGYLAALQHERARFQSLGATATDHGHPSAQTADLSPHDAEALFTRISSAPASPADAELFRAQMLTEMARMSLADGLVMQLHPGSLRNHNQQLFACFGPDMGADIPTPTDYVRALRPLLNRFGNEPALTLILFTLDESAYSRELAPLAGHYPCLRLGPPWWFHDSPEGMLRFRQLATETAGLYNTVGFNDDTRAFLSIPARHDAARRMDAVFLARLVAEHRLPLDEALDAITALTSTLVRQAYRLDSEKTS